MEDLSKLTAVQLKDLCKIQRIRIEDLEREVNALRSLSFWDNVKKQFKLDTK